MWQEKGALSIIKKTKSGTVGNEIICNIQVLKSNLWDYNYSYVLKRGDTTTSGNIVAQVAFKSCVSISITCCNIVRIILEQQEVYDFVLKMRQVILMLILEIMIILNISSKKLMHEIKQKL